MSPHRTGRAHGLEAGPITVFKDYEFNVKDSLKACSLEAPPRGGRILQSVISRLI